MSVLAAEHAMVEVEAARDTMVVEGVLMGDGVEVVTVEEEEEEGVEVVEMVEEAEEVDVRMLFTDEIYKIEKY